MGLGWKEFGSLRGGSGSRPVSEVYEPTTVFDSAGPYFDSEFLQKSPGILPAAPEGVESPRFASRSRPRAGAAEPALPAFFGGGAREGGRYTAPMLPSPTSPSRAFLTLVLSFLALTGCRGPDVREELSEAGFRTPEQTFETYRAAFLSDLPQLEYLCFSDGFRRSNGMSLLNYGEAREILLDQQPFLRYGLGRAKILEQHRLDDRRARLRIRTESLFHRIDFVCDLVREDFYEIWSGGSRLQDDYLNRFSQAFRVTEQGDASYAQAYVALEDPERAGEITEFRVGREWKIDFLTQIDPKQPTLPHGDSQDQASGETDTE